MVEACCLCGGVRFRVGGPFELMAHCHCGECRKASGADYATNATVGEEQIEWLSGRDSLGRYESSPGNVRCFCSRCGSPVMKLVASKPGKVRIRLGLLEGDPGSRPLMHVFVGEGAPWTEIHDELPRFERLPVPPKSEGSSTDL